MSKVVIGSNYTPPPSARRTGFGDFEHYMPQPSEDDERLQWALLGKATAQRSRLRLVSIAVAVVVAVAVLVVLA